MKIQSFNSSQPKMSVNNNLQTKRNIANNNNVSMPDYTLSNCTTNRYLIHFKGSDDFKNNFSDKTELNRAVYCDNRKKIVELAEKNNIKQKDLDEITCIAAFQNPDVLPLLQKFEKFNINCTDELGQTPLMKLVGSVFAYDNNIIPVLNNEKTAINLQDNLGCTALMHACDSSYTNLYIIKEFFNRDDLDFTIRNNANKSALQIAIEHGRLDIAKYIAYKGNEILDMKLNKLITEGGSEEEIEKLKNDKLQMKMDCFLLHIS